MNCQSIQNQISTYLDCELDAELKREVRKHLFDCPECNTAYQELLTLKNSLENVEVPEIQFDSLAILYARLETEKRIIVQRPVFIMWGPRFLIAAACFSLFFLSALALFPVENTSNPSLAGDSEPQRSSYGGVSFDRNFSFDRSVTVYQASVILP